VIELKEVAFRLGVTAVLLWVVWRAEVPALALLYGAPVLGALWAGPLMEGLIALNRALRQQALGRSGAWMHHFHGRPVGLHPDAQGQLWVDAATVRRLGVALPDDARLAGHFPARGLRRVAQRLQLRVDLLAEQLRHSSQPASVRLARWLARQRHSHQAHRAAMAIGAAAVDLHREQRGG